jgi:hypothetical protein
MVSFRTMQARCRIAGFHCHHLIPRKVVEDRKFAMLFARLRLEGFDPNDFVANGMHLPAVERNARIFRLPLHGGPHRRYNDAVTEFVAGLERLSPADGFVHLGIYQRSLRAMLRSGQADAADLLRNPMHAHGSRDFETLDRIIERMGDASIRL